MAATSTSVDTGNWEQITNLPTFKKWKYGTSPYRVIADLEEGRGHWRALFVSVYGTDSYLIAGNLGSGDTGRLQAVGHAKQFMMENKYGCPPPGDYE